jgi:iron complex outermembrane recepter protein
VTGIVPDANIIAGCVPTNLFGGAGSVTPAQLAYLSPELTNHGVNEEQIADATVRGSWGQLPAGTISWAVGAQYRRESGSNATWQAGLLWKPVSTVH